MRRSTGRQIILAVLLLVILAAVLISVLLKKTVCSAVKL